jgi:hypothetical protein
MGEVHQCAAIMFVRGTRLPGFRFHTLAFSCWMETLRSKHWSSRIWWCHPRDRSAPTHHSSNSWSSLLLLLFIVFVCSTYTTTRISLSLEQWRRRFYFSWPVFWQQQPHFLYYQPSPLHVRVPSVRNDATRLLPSTVSAVLWFCWCIPHNMYYMYYYYSHVLYTYYYYMYFYSHVLYTYII